MAGVSKTIVSQFLNNNYKFMSNATKERIEKIVKETNYIPKSSAQNLKYKKTKVINIIVANLSSSFSTQVAQYIDTKVSSQNTQVTISNSNDDSTKEKLLIEQAISQDVDGVIIFPVGGNEELYRLLQKKKITTVFVDRIPIGLDYYSCVLLDNDSAIEKSVVSLAQRGHKQITYLSLPIEEHLTPRVERLQAFWRILEKQDKILPHIVYGSETSMKSKLKTLFTSSNYFPSAFIASNDTCLTILLKTLKELKIDKKIDIVTIDGYDLYELIDSIYMSIEHPIQDICEQIIDCLNLDEAKEDNDEEKHIYRFEPKLISR